MCKCSPRQRPLHQPSEREPKFELFPATIPAFTIEIVKLFLGLLDVFDVLVCENDFSLERKLIGCHAGAGESSDLRDVA